VIAKIKQIYLQRRLAALEALNRGYADIAINYFWSEQKTGINTPGRWWYNRTEQAAARMFGDTVRNKNEMGWRIVHGIDYGVWLTLANDRKHDALTAIINRFAGRYLNDVKRLFGG